MKSLSFIDLIIYFSIFLITGLIFFLIFSLTKVTYPSLSGDFIKKSSITTTPPLYDIVGKVFSKTDNKITIVPTKKSLFQNKKVTVSISDDTIINKIYPPIPFHSKENKDLAIISSTSQNNIQTGDILGIESYETNNNLYFATSIQINLPSFFISGRITRIDSNSLEIISPAVTKDYSEKTGKLLNVKIYQILIKETTEISKTYTDSKGNQSNSLISLRELAPDDNLFIYSLDDPETTLQLKAEIVNLQKVE